MKRRTRKGQSMVEYALGIGCVAAVCMLVLGGLGHAGADIVRQVLVNINDPDDQSADPGSIFKNGVKGTANAPWQLQ